MLCVYDVTGKTEMRLDLASFNRAKKEIEKAGQGTDLLFVLVGNKADQGN